MEIPAVLKILADENRLRILNIIKEGEACVGEISTILGLARPNVSKHLEKLKAAGFITARKHAQWIYYSIDASLVERHPFVKAILFEELKKEEVFTKDMKRLQTYQTSGFCCQDLRNAGFDFEKIKEAAEGRRKG